MGRNRKSAQPAATDANAAPEESGEVMTQAEEQENSANSAPEQAPAEGLEVSPPDAPGEDAAIDQEDVSEVEYTVHLNPDFGDRQKRILVGDNEFLMGRTYRLTAEQYEEVKDAQLEGTPVLKEGGVE